jgi:dihydroorotate dehydrogenase (NAD+) catalytic subunit
MIAGASAIQLGTVNFINPGSAEDIIKGLEDYCITNGIERLADTTGSFII